MIIIVLNFNVEYLYDAEQIAVGVQILNIVKKKKAFFFKRVQ